MRTRYLRNKSLFAISRVKALHHTMITLSIITSDGVTFPFCQMQMGENTHLTLYLRPFKRITDPESE